MMTIIERPVLLPEEIVSLRDKKNKARNIAIREIITSESKLTIYCQQNNLV